MKFATFIAAAVAASFVVPLAAQTSGAPADASSTPSQRQPAAAGRTAPGSAAAGASALNTELFKALDKDGDGFISREESKGSTHEPNFSALDKDRDGKLSESEYAAAQGASGARSR